MKKYQYYAGQALNAMVSKLPLLVNAEGIHGTNAMNTDDLRAMRRAMVRSAHDYAELMVAEEKRRKGEM